MVYTESTTPAAPQDDLSARADRSIVTDIPGDFNSGIVSILSDSLCAPPYALCTVTYHSLPVTDFTEV